MKIAFRKISSQKTDFSVSYDTITFTGTFKRDSKYVDIEAEIVGEIEVLCDRCGAEMPLLLDEKVAIKVSDGYDEGDDLDIIESHDSHVDFDQIAASEIEALKAEYHYCTQCKQLEGE